MSFIKGFATGFMGAAIQQNAKNEKLKDRMIETRMNELLRVDDERRKKQEEAAAIASRAKEAVAMGVFDDVNKAIFILSNPAYKNKPLDELYQVGKSIKEKTPAPASTTGAGATAVTAPTANPTLVPPDAVQSQAQPNMPAPQGQPPMATPGAISTAQPPINAQTRGLMQPQTMPNGETRMRTGRFTKDIVLPSNDKLFQQMTGRQMASPSTGIPAIEGGKQYTFDGANAQTKDLAERIMANPSNFLTPQGFEIAKKLYVAGDYASIVPLAKIDPNKAAKEDKIYIEMVSALTNPAAFKTPEERAKFAEYANMYKKSGDIKYVIEGSKLVNNKDPNAAAKTTSMNPVYTGIRQGVAMAMGAKVGRDADGNTTYVFEDAPLASAVAAEAEKAAIETDGQIGHQMAVRKGMEIVASKLPDTDPRKKNLLARINNFGGPIEPAIKPTGPSGPQSKPTTPLPKAGDVVEHNGTKAKFKGGDPSKPENWEVIK